MLSSFDKKISEFESLDSEISSEDLQRSFWFINHKILLRNLGIATWLVADILLIAYALSGFISYVWTGQPQEVASIASLAQRLNTSSVTRQKNEAAIPLDFSGGQVMIFDAGDEKYDFAVPVQNQNRDWYALVTYQFDVTGVGPTPSKTTFVLPGEKKYLTALGVPYPGQTISDASLKIVNIMWSRIDSHAISDVPTFLQDHASFEVVSSTFIGAGSITKDGIAPDTGNRITFAVTNHSAYNFWSVPVQVILMRSGGVQGIEETQIDNFRTGETRAMDIRNYVKDQLVDEVDVIPSVDVFDTGVYMPQ
jgi:hypothetical protein